MDKYDFGNKLYEYRTQKGLTQKELGKLLGVTDKAVSKWETGESKPRLDKMTQITMLFETSIDSMLGNEKTENGEQLRPYKTIFDSQLEKYSKHYKAARIWTYIFAIICVAFSCFRSVTNILNGGLATEKVSSFIGILVLTSAAVIFTLKFKPRFSECNYEDMNIFMGFISAMFFGIGALTIIPVVRIGRITGEYDWITIGFICAEALIISVVALISSRKKRYYVFLCVLCIFSLANLFLFNTFYYFVIYAATAQFACFIDKRNWLSLAEKVDVEIKKSSEGQKTANIFVAVIAVITVLGIVFSSFSPYIIYKIALKKYYPTYKHNEIIDYNYSTEFDENYKEIEFQGAKLKIPEGYEIDHEYNNGFEKSVYYKDAQNNIITVLYYSDENNSLYYDESDIEALDPDEAVNVKADYAKIKIADSLYQKYFGVSLVSFYGNKYILYFVDLEDVKFYESQKSTVLIPILFVKLVADTGRPMSASKFDDGRHCGLIGGYQMPSAVFWTADVWHSNNKNGAYYTITFCDRNSSDITDNQMICKLVNSLEF